MVIGIDEVGNFASDSDKFHFFIAIKIDQNDNGYERKKQQFQKWFDTIPADKKNKNGEVKGTDLTEDELFRFADTVIAADPIVRAVQVRIVPKETPTDLVTTFKEIEIKRLENLIALYKEKNKPILAEEYQKLVYWYKNRNYEQFLKILILNNAICHSLEQTIGASILLELLCKDEKNLLNIKLKIDRDFINAQEPKTFWGDFLRNTFKRFTDKYPIPVLDEWEKNGHPFLEKYGTTDGKLDFKEILRDNTQFLHSHEHFEIQMADITGTIYHRYQNKNTCKPAYDKIVERLSGKKHKIIQLSQNSLTF